MGLVATLQVYDAHARGTTCVEKAAVRVWCRRGGIEMRKVCEQQATHRKHGKLRVRQFRGAIGNKASRALTAIHFFRSACLLSVKCQWLCVLLLRFVLCLFPASSTSPISFSKRSLPLLLFFRPCLCLLVSVISHAQALLLPDTRKSGRTHASHRQQGEGSARSCPLSPAFQSRVALPSSSLANFP